MRGDLASPVRKSDSGPRGGIALKSEKERAGSEMTIPIGTIGESRFVVTPDRAVDFLGLKAARVLGTAQMIYQLEITARDSVLPYLSEGYDTVGTAVNVRHLAATPLGMEVTFRCELVSVTDRRLTFSVSAFDEIENIAEGTHERSIVEVARFVSRVGAKASHTS